MLVGLFSVVFPIPSLLCRFMNLPRGSTSDLLVCGDDSCEKQELLL